ncbi:hypothetical protein TPA4_30 [Tsukamurella phage TPA4]|uniref:hypothetical protein n=1 Tax=Tsukamurella phage TPA4 TaxID=1647476 RepID=UPI0007B626C8|nr:hypothetical protein BH784_gp30 [Tsukamurella phage TPA4]AKJ72195.1 hypothetical protein TPA4_30 [Tsukamurella phage TPA4]
MSTPITVATVRGCGEPLTNHLLLEVIRQLPKDRFRHVEIVHPATMGPVGGPINSPSMLATINEGVRLLDGAYAAARGRFVGLGYSQGGSLLTEWLNRRDPGGQGGGLPKLALAGFIANPSRVEGRSYGRKAPGQGIYAANQRHRLGWAEIAAPGDVITAMSADSPLRTGAGLIRAMSLADPIGWALDVAPQLTAARLAILGREPWQAVNPRFWTRWKEAIDGMYAYARLGSHTDAYRRRDWKDWRGQPVSGIDLLARAVKTTAA